MSSSSSPSWSRLALGSGVLLGGAYAGLSALRWRLRQGRPAPLSLPPALAWSTGILESPWGAIHYYERPGRGVPVVLLHSFNAVASSYEMKPIAEHLAETTDRPLYAIDWLGFGRSDRTAASYRPAVYRHQLFQVLTEVVDGPADLVGLSLGAEYAAHAGLQAAPHVRRLALLSPTGFSSSRGPSALGRLGLSLAGHTGAFELLFYRLTRRASLRDYYERQVFLDANAVPQDLIDYAHTTAQARGAHRAPRRFVDGSLFLDDVARDVYARLYRPTLLLLPKRPGPTVQQFDLLPDLLTRDLDPLRHTLLPGGLMPHWEAPAPCLEALDSFLEA